MMMQGLRNAGRSWLGKAVVGVLFALLIVSFAIFGISDVFRGGASTTVATVGSVEIGAQQVREAYQRQLDDLSRRARRQVTTQQARAAGIDRQVLQRLIGEAVLDARADTLGLGISDEAIAQSILTDPNFRGANGQFDRATFNEILRSNGLTEAAFVRTQRAVYRRRQIAEALTGGLEPPPPLLEALWRARAESRTLDWFALMPGNADAIAEPSEDVLRTFFNERRASFRAPERRTINILTLGPSDVPAANVSEDDLRRRYEAERARFTTPERRLVQQLVFPNEAEARAAAERLAAGTDFEALAAERGVRGRDLELGLVTRGEILDPAVRDAAFGLAPGAVSGVVAGQFGSVIVRAARVEPEATRPFADVQAELRAAAMADAARAAVGPLHDRIEDLRASGRPLAEVAREVKLQPSAIGPIDRSGSNESGAPVTDLPERERLLDAAFRGEVGVDTEALTTRDGGYVWFEVAGVTPARDLDFEVARPSGVAAWKAEEAARQLAEKAAQAVARVRGGETLEAVATSLGATVRRAEDIRRSGSIELGRAVVEAAFTTPVGGAGTALGANGRDRVVFAVRSATVPPFVPTTSEAVQFTDQIRTLLTEDLLAAYVAAGEKELGLNVNERAFRTAIGGEG